MCLTFKKNNKQAKKPVNRFLQDDASAGIWSLQTSIEITLPKPMERTIYRLCDLSWRFFGIQDISLYEIESMSKFE